MFVVRITPPEGEPKLHAFEKRPDAKDWFDAAVIVATQHEIAATVALFEVAVKDDAPLARQMVIEGRATLLGAKRPKDILSDA